METTTTQEKIYSAGQEVRSIKLDGPIMMVDGYDEKGWVTCMWFENTPYSSQFRKQAFPEDSLKDYTEEAKRWRDAKAGLGKDLGKF